MQELDIPQFVDALLDGCEIPDAPLEEMPEEERQQIEARRQAFAVKDASDATWCMKKIAHHRRRFNEYKAVADAEIERAKAFIERQQAMIEAQRRRLEADESFFIGKLIEFYLPQHMANPRLKTFKTPAGSFSIRQERLGYERNDKALLAWLKERVMPDYIKTTEQPMWGELQALTKALDSGAVVLADTGEIVDGVRAVPKPLKFTVATEEV